MLHGSHHPGAVGSELTHLLARLDPMSAAPFEPSTSTSSSTPKRPVFAERLGHWLGWKGAISLSTALNAATAEASSGRSPASRSDVGRVPGREEADFIRVRAALMASIDGGPREDASRSTDFGPYRRHCVQQQQAMHDAISALRHRLRSALSQRSPALARLASVDAVMDQTLAQHERGLLGLVPLRLQSHFETLQRTAAADPAWRESFCLDMARLLRAESEHRLLPARGLLDALLTPPPT